MNLSESPAGINMKIFPCIKDSITISTKNGNIDIIEESSETRIYFHDYKNIEIHNEIENFVGVKLNKLSEN